jgi:hypothetical protein
MTRVLCRLSNPSRMDAFCPCCMFFTVGAASSRVSAKAPMEASRGTQDCQVIARRRNRKTRMGCDRDRRTTTSFT